MTIFFLDQYRGLVEGEAPKWRLLFDGDIVGYQYVNSPEGRSLSYSAVDQMEALGRIFAFFITDLLSAAESQLSVQGNAVSIPLNPLAPMAALFSVGFADGQPMSRPFDFVDNVLRSLGSSDPPFGNQRSVIATNWFSAWDARVGFSKRFVPSFGIEDKAEPGTEQLPGVFPLLKAAQEEKAVEALIALGNEVANNQSMYALIQSVFQHVFYELHMNLAPPYVKVNALTRDIEGTPRETMSQDAGLESQASGDQEKVIASYFTKPQTLFGLPPACNVFWPSMIRQFSFAENYARQPTRTYVGNPHLYNVMQGKLTKTGNAALNQAAMRALTSAYPFKPADEKLTAKHESKTKKELNHHNFLVYPEEFFKGPVYYNHNMPPIFTYLAKYQEDDSKRLTRLYAKYEHFRQRYANRNGGLSLDFDPYVVHGFSCMIVDNEESNLHCQGYITQVSHSLSQNDMSTSVSFTYGQTLDDFFERIVEDIDEFGLFGTDASLGPATREQIPSAPKNPIESVRNQFQVYPAAVEYFRNMLWRTEEWDGDAIVFNYMDVFGVRDEDSGELSDIFIQPQAQETESNVVPDEASGKTPRFEVKGAFQEYMNNSEEAFKYASRPVCTLEEWIEAQPNGVKEGPRAANDPKEGKGADYWVQVLELVQGPGTEPSKDTEGNPCEATDTDTRRNWRDRILRFRQKVYQDAHHHRA
jgi:hypothetical protein